MPGVVNPGSPPQEVITTSFSSWQQVAAKLHAGGDVPTKAGAIPLWQMVKCIFGSNPPFGPAAMDDVVKVGEMRWLSNLEPSRSGAKNDNFKIYGLVKNINMVMLEEELGRALRSQEVADFLGVDEKTIRQYYKDLGGIRLGRLYLFFEKEVVHAIQARRQMGSPGEEEWEKEGGDFQDRKRSFELGGGLEKKIIRRLGRPRDSHGLLSN